ncbi:MAG: D-alanyl-D-alanine carboxypeptidase [Magnetococcales bacterium]|nr:D-alanyl-D-alanine carboxypeptidase [Magnetococcales bacterium]
MNLINHRFRSWVCAILLVIAPVTGVVWAAPAAVTHQEEPQTFEVRAESAVLGDLDTGMLMIEQASDVRRDPASLTKVMTLYLAFDALARGTMTMETKLLVSERAWRTGGSKTFVKVGDEVSVHDLLMGIAVQSGNDACTVVAEHISGSEKGFADLMTQKAKQLGMNNSHFTNASGLPEPDHYSSARDMFILARAIMNDFPQYVSLFREKQHTFNGIRQFNRNRLLWRDPHITGMKTGHTQTAGYCLIATSDKDGQRLGTVLLGTKSSKIREEEALRLLRHGNRLYETVHVYDKGAAVRQFRVWKGERERVDGIVEKPVLVSVLRRDRGKIESGLTYNDPIVAPLNQGDRLGTLTVRMGNQEIMSAAVVAAQKIEPAGFFGRLADSVRMYFGWQ